MMPVVKFALKMIAICLSIFTFTLCLFFFISAYMNENMSAIININALGEAHIEAIIIPPLVVLYAISMYILITDVIHDTGKE